MIPSYIESEILAKRAPILLSYMFISGHLELYLSMHTGLSIVIKGLEYYFIDISLVISEHKDKKSSSL